jgi:hypothetical protein
MFTFRRRTICSTRCASGVSCSCRTRFEQAAASHALGIDQVMAMGRAYAAFSREEPLYFEMMTELQARENASQPASAAEESAERHGQGCLVHVAAALARGLQDQSVHPGIGDPGATALSIWAFTHGLLQISAKKAVMLETKFKLTQHDMIEHGFALLRSALATGKAAAGSGDGRTPSPERRTLARAGRLSARQSYAEKSD